MKKICLITGGYVLGCFALIGLKYVLERVDKNVRSSRRIFLSTLSKTYFKPIRAKQPKT